MNEVIDNVLWFVQEWPFIALVAAWPACFVVAWFMAFVLSRLVNFGAKGVFYREIRGFRAWIVGLLVHALLLFGLGLYFFLFEECHWSFLIPYAVVIAIDVALIAGVAGKAENLRRQSA